MFYYLDEVCEEIKYKTIHKDIRNELQSHIDEMAEQYGEIYGDHAREFAARSMGNAKELGSMLNRQYKMPFNSQWGLAIWAAINAILGWTLYPLWMTIWRHYTSVATFAACAVLVYCVLNMLYLRRTHFKCSFRDWGHIALGTLAGSAAAVTALLIASAIAGTFGCYTYGVQCAIPYIWRPWNYEMPMLLFFYWAMWMMYMLSLGKPRGWKKHALKYEIMRGIFPEETMDWKKVKKASAYYDEYGDARGVNIWFGDNPRLRQKKKED